MTAGGMPASWNARILAETRRGLGSVVTDIPVMWVSYTVAVNQAFDSTGLFSGRVPSGSLLTFGDICIDRRGQPPPGVVPSFLDISSIHFESHALCYLSSKVFKP